MKTKLVNIYIFISALLLLLIGGFISISPTKYLLQFQEQLVSSVELLSELRGMGGMLVGFSTLAFVSLFAKELKKTSLISLIIIFSSFSIFRVFGIIMDGLPNSSILIALSIEIIFTFLGIISYKKQ